MSDVEAVATITSKGQMTLPKPMRSALGLGAGTQVHCTMKDGAMEVRKLQEDHIDPVLDSFLQLLAKDIGLGNLMTELPSHVEEFMATRDLSKVDIDEVIEGEVVI